MKKVLGVIVITWVTVASSQNRENQQVWNGRLSDSMCGASHQAMAAARNLSERDCLFECIKALAKYVLVDDKQQVIPIATQDLGGLPLYAGRPVRITGTLKDGAIVATKIEAIPAHLHLGHVMTNWTDTPSNVGFLIVAISDAKVAAIHGDLAAKSADLESMKLHAGHVLNALDSSIEPKGPASGYGVKKAVGNALQHLGLAVQAEGVTGNIRTYAAQASGSLTTALQSTEQAVDIAQQIRASNNSTEAAALVKRLATLTNTISEVGLQAAKSSMDLLMKGEGLQNAPR
jgi:hypothetical protein